MKLKLADGVRAPRPDEYPTGADHEKIDATRAAANIVQGYRLRSEPGGPDDRFVAECNVDADRLWALFEALAFVLPEPVSGIIGVKDEEPMFSEYAEKAAVLADLHAFSDELVHDGFLAFGVIHQTASANEEVFVTSPKYLRVWGADLERFRGIMARFDLLEVPELAFIDELPIVSESLRVVRGETARHHLEVIDEVHARFDALVPWRDEPTKSPTLLH